MTDPRAGNITVVVIAYHAATTVIETLDSIKAQSYGARKIELIIADDASTDGTVDKIADWLARNGQCFFSTRLIANRVNIGTTKNCNQCWKLATSDWIKTIAGDDLLLPECLALNRAYVECCPDVSVMFSLVESFSVNASGENVIRNLLPPGYQRRLLMTATAAEQCNYLQRADIECTPAAFINRRKLAAIGFADERMRLVEDLPLWYRFVKRGYRLHFFPQPTVRYRLSGCSVTRSSTRLVNIPFIQDVMRFDSLVVMPDLAKKQLILRVRKYLWPKLALAVVFVFSNKRHLLSKIIFSAVLLMKPNGVRRQVVKLLERFTSPPG